MKLDSALPSAGLVRVLLNTHSLRPRASANSFTPVRSLAGFSEERSDAQAQHYQRQEQQ